MNRWKQWCIYGCVMTGILGTGVYLILSDMRAPLTTKPLVLQEEKPEKPEIDAVSYLIEKAQEMPKGIIVSPKTTNELRAWFGQGDETHLPRVFVEQLPADFATQGDKELFARVFGALALRENEKILRERAIVTLLRQKYEQGAAWSEQEDAYFQSLVDKYYAKSKREKATQLADLSEKLDIIPPMTAVIQAAEATDWGKGQLKSPYQQYGWLDSKTYDLIAYPSLIEATDAYAREMIGLPSLKSWRVSRNHLRGREMTDVGFRVLRWLDSYNQEDRDYTNRLHRRVEELGHDIPDTLSFWKDTVTLGWAAIQIHTDELKYELTVDVAKTPEQQARGLMFRPEIHRGMVFLYDQERPVSFWMKNTFVPLDMVFFDKEGKVVKIVQNAEPLSEKSIPSEVPVAGVLELAGGAGVQYGIKIGDTIVLQ